MQAIIDRGASATKWDRAGIAGSLLCIFHCVATPSLAAALPVLAVTERETHIGLTGLLMVTGLLAFLPGYRHHSKPLMALVGALGFAMLVLAVMIPAPFGGETLETLLTVVGGLLLIGAHLTNAYYCRHCQLCAEDPHAAVGGPAAGNSGDFRATGARRPAIIATRCRAGHCTTSFEGGDAHDSQTRTGGP